MRKSLILLTIMLVSCTGAQQSVNDSVTDGRRYCNPLPMVIGPGGNASGDVSVFRDDDGRYYLFCTGGGAWHSDNMLDWEFTPVQRVPVAPDVVKFRGKYYMSGNDCPLYVADNPLGPYSVLGDWENTPDVEGGWNEPFDMHIFIDDDKPYLFYSGRGISGIFGVPLDPDRMNRFADKPTHLFSFNPQHEWERYGEMNEYTGVAWIEGPWLFKYKGTYYMQYSASGTQWKTYAEGYYTAKHPLGPYTYADNNPLLRKTEGLVTGTAHGSVVEGPDGGLWQFYTIVLSNPPGGRRIGMDRIDVDKKGRWSVQITDTPQPAPGVKSARVSLPVTINKMNAMNALSKFSSQQPGRYASYAVDNSSGTVWEPDPQDPEPSITIELSPATRFDEVQLFDVDAVRIMFNTGGRRGFGGGGGAATVYKYKVDVSLDGETYTTVLDNTSNTEQRNTIFEEFKPVEARFVRLTVTEWPGTQLGVIEFTAFGLPGRTEPARVAIPPVITY